MCEYCDCKDVIANFVKGDEYTNYEGQSSQLISRSDGAKANVWISEIQEWDEDQSSFWLNVGDEDESSSTEISYCPMCGRKLVGAEHRPN